MPPPPPPPVEKREEPFVPATILILGGYGTVGTAICRTLLQQSSTVKLFVAGRTEGKASALCKQLNSDFPPAPKGGPRAVAMCADASDSSTLADCPRFGAPATHRRP